MIAPNGLRAVIFDLDGTLRHNRPPGHEVFWEFAATLGAPASAEARRRALRWAHAYWAASETMMADAEALERGSDPFWENYALRHLQALGCPPEQARALAPPVFKHMAEEYQPEDWVPPEVPAILNGLRAADLAVGLLTNRHRPIDEYLDEIGLSAHLDFHLAAGEVELWKPDPELFRHLLAKARLEPEQAVYVGDNYYADVVGARRAGLTPVLYDPETVFPDADCAVIRRLDELPHALAGGHAS